MVQRLWWEREDLTYRNDRLVFGNRDLLKFVQSAPTPVYLYNSERVRGNLTRLGANLKKAGVKFKTLHFHIGSGYLTPDIPILDDILTRCHWFLDRCPDIDTLDIGGGLGVPLVEGQSPLDLARWSDVIARHARGKGLTIHLEPGDFLIKDAGVLIVQVNTVEDKGGTKFIGVNGGFNIHSAAAYYDIPFIPAPLERRPSDSGQKITIAGNINEAIDLLAEYIWMPPIQEGDYLALLNAGGYGSASSSNHCMRGIFSEYLIVD